MHRAVIVALMVLLAVLLASALGDLLAGDVQQVMKQVSLSLDGK